MTEIWLSSEDTGAYGRDVGSSLSELLEALVAVLPQDVMLRVGMTNPPFILEQLDPIAKALQHPNVFAFLHVPVQSGSDRVLQAMRREYSVEDFTRLADFLLDRVPGLCLATVRPHHHQQLQAVQRLPPWPPPPSLTTGLLLCSVSGVVLVP